MKRGYHWHKCPRIGCGYLWQHHYNKWGDVKAHTCRKCGAEQWWQYVPGDD